MTNKDAICAGNGHVDSILTIPVEIHDTSMMLRWPLWPDERRDRAKVNEAVRRLVELGLKVKK